VLKFLFYKYNVENNSNKEKNK